MKVINLSLLFFIIVMLVSAQPSYARRYVNQGGWAVGLVRGLEWEKKGIPAHPSLTDYFDLLSGRNFINVNLKNYVARHGTVPATLTYNVNISHSGRYNLIAYVSGNPVMFAIDNKSTVSSTLSRGWNYEEIGSFTLKRGMHKLSVTIPRGGTISALYLSSLVVNSIKPKGGWAAKKIIDYGTEAGTIVMAMDIAGKLPVKARIPFTVKAGDDAYEFIFQLRSDSIINFRARFAGSSKGYIMVDNSTVIPYNVANGQAPIVNFKAFNVARGRHIAYLKILSGKPPSVFIINQHNNSPNAYVSLMRLMGFSMGSAYQPVPYNIVKASLGKLMTKVVKKTPRKNIHPASPPLKQINLPTDVTLIWQRAAVVKRPAQKPHVVVPRAGVSVLNASGNPKASMLIGVTLIKNKINVVNVSVHKTVEPRTVIYYKPNYYKQALGIAGLLKKTPKLVKSDAEAC